MYEDVRVNVAIGSKMSHNKAQVEEVERGLLQ